MTEDNLSKEQAEQLKLSFFEEIQNNEYDIRSQEVDESSLTMNEKTIRWTECFYGDKEEGGKRSLWISMHGGGSCPSEVNDQQYQNQICLYEPDEGIWIIPRSPTDSWNQWHQEHIDPMFDRIIENFILLKNVDPNRVYLLGYSAGGDGVYQLAPRMADRFAAAAMMAGHPNNSTPCSLRNLPFAIFVGENDSAYNRNQAARCWAEKLNQLEQEDMNGGYRHKVEICRDMSHWMCGKDREALPWLAQWRRNPWPEKIVWRQGNVIHDRFYWLAIKKRKEIQAGSLIHGEVDNQRISIDTDENIEELTIRLSDSLVDLEKPIEIFHKKFGKVFENFVDRKSETIFNSLKERADVESAATAQVDLSFAW